MRPVSVSPSGWLVCGDDVAMLPALPAATAHVGTTGVRTVRLLCTAMMSACVAHDAIAFSNTAATALDARAGATRRAAAVDLVARVYGSGAAASACGAIVLRCDTGAVVWAVAPLASACDGVVRCVHAVMPSPRRLCGVLRDDAGATRLFYAARPAVRRDDDSTTMLPLAQPCCLASATMRGEVRAVATTASPDRVLVLTSSGDVYVVALPTRSQLASDAATTTVTVHARVVARVPAAYVTADTRLAARATADEIVVAVVYTRGADVLYVARMHALHDDDDDDAEGDESSHDATPMHVAGRMAAIDLVDDDTIVATLRRCGASDKDGRDDDTAVAATGLQLLRYDTTTTRASQDSDMAVVWLPRPVCFVSYNAASAMLCIGCSDGNDAAACGHAAEAQPSLLASLVWRSVPLPSRDEGDSGDAAWAATLQSSLPSPSSWQRVVTHAHATRTDATPHALQLLLPYLHDDASAGTRGKSGTSSSSNDNNADMTLCYAVTTATNSSTRTQCGAAMDNGAAAGADAVGTAVLAVTATAAVHTRLLREQRHAAVALAHVLRGVVAAVSAHASDDADAACAPLLLPWHPRHMRRALRLLTPTQLTLLFRCMTATLWRCTHASARGGDDGGDVRGYVAPLYSCVATTVASAAVLLVTLARQLGVVLSTADVRPLVLLLRASRAAAHELLPCTARMRLVMDSYAQRRALRSLLLQQHAATRRMRPTTASVTAEAHGSDNNDSKDSEHDASAASLSSTFYGIPHTMPVQPARLSTRYAVTTWADDAAHEAARHDAVRSAAAQYLDVLRRDGLLACDDKPDDTGDDAAAATPTRSLCNWHESGARAHVDAVLAAFETTLLQR